MCVAQFWSDNQKQVSKFLYPQTFWSSWKKIWDLYMVAWSYTILVNSQYMRISVVLLILLLKVRLQGRLTLQFCLNHMSALPSWLKTWNKFSTFKELNKNTICLWHFMLNRQCFLFLILTTFYLRHTTHGTTFFCFCSQNQGPNQLM